MPAVVAIRSERLHSLKKEPTNKDSLTWQGPGGREVTELNCCIIKPKEEYGLFKTYKACFSTISRTCISMFCWEDERAPIETRLVTLDNIVAYEELDALIPPTQHPEEYVNKLRSTKDLPRIYNTREQLINIAELRLMQWKKHYRGVVSESGKVVRVKFGEDRGDYRQLDDFLSALFE